MYLNFQDLFSKNYIFKLILDFKQYMNKKKTDK